MWISHVFVTVALILSLWTRDIIGTNEQETSQDFKLPTQLKVHYKISVTGQKSPTALRISIKLMTNTSSEACTTRLRFKSNEVNYTLSEEDATEFASNTFNVTFDVTEYGTIQTFHGASAASSDCPCDDYTLQSIERLSIVGEVNYINFISFTMT